MLLVIALLAHFSQGPYGWDVWIQTPSWLSAGIGFAHGHPVAWLQTATGTAIHTWFQIG